MAKTGVGLLSLLSDFRKLLLYYGLGVKLESVLLNAGYQASFYLFRIRDLSHIGILTLGYLF